jgi:hypothetical protein
VTTRDVSMSLPCNFFPPFVDHKTPRLCNTARITFLFLSTSMASNAPGQSTQSAYNLGPSVSLDRGAAPFALGECVLVRIPEPIQVEGYVENEATIVGTNLSPVSVGSGPQHISFVRGLDLLADGSFVLEVYPVLSFSNNGGALVAYNTMNDAAAKAALLPLPPLSSRHPRPDAFGRPLAFGNWSTAKDSFLHIFPRRFIMTTKRAVSPFVDDGKLVSIDFALSLNEWSLPFLCHSQT